MLIVDPCLSTCLQYMQSMKVMVIRSMFRILENSNRITDVGLRVLELLLSVAIFGLVLAPRGSGG